MLNRLKTPSLYMVGECRAVAGCCITLNKVKNISRRIKTNMRFNEFYLKEDINYIEQLEDGTVKIIVDPDRWPVSKLSRINTAMKRKGYDVRGTEDVARIIKKMAHDDSIITHDDWADTIKKAFPPKVEKSLAETIRSKVVRYFGLTTDFKIAGYITPDGKLIDLSGRRLGSDGKTRQVDHREVNAALEDIDHPVSQGGTAGMNEFMKFGYIRIDFNAGMIDAETEPTAIQYNVLVKFLSSCKSDVIQISLNGKGRAYFNSVDRESNGARKIYNMIRGYYAGNVAGITSKFHESVEYKNVGYDDYYDDESESNDKYIEQAEKLVKLSGMNMLRNDQLSVVAIDEETVVGVMYSNTFIQMMKSDE